MKDGTKCTKWGGLGWLGSLKVICNVTVRYSAYNFLFNFNKNCLPCTVYEIEWVSCRKSPILPSLSVFGAPVGGDLVRITRRSLASINYSHANDATRVWRCLRDLIRLAILIRYRLVTDGQTDRRTHGHSIYRAIRTRGVIKSVMSVSLFSLYNFRIAWPLTSTFECEQVTTIARQGLKIKIIGQRSKIIR